MTTPAIVGERVRTLRLAMNISQSDLARQLSNGETEGNTLISRIENGRYPLDDTTIHSLAAALDCQPQFFTRDVIEVIGTRPWLRAYADAPARTVESVVADNALVAEAIERLQLRRIPDGSPVFDGDLNDPFAIESFADDVRAAAGLVDGSVVGNAMRAADRLGCVVLPLGGELGRHLGMSQRVNGIPFIRVSRPGLGDNFLPGDRQRFTVLHEVGHLAMHAELPPPRTADEARRIEQQAHRFASAFLAPADALIDDWNRHGSRTSLSVLAELKATWGIAIKALVMRFQQLGIISSDQATSLYKQISKRGWNKAEPVKTTNEQPIWLVKALEKRAHHGDGGTALSTAAQVTMLSESHVQGWIDWTPITPSGEVVKLAPRARSSTSPTSDPAQVLTFRRGR